MDLNSIGALRERLSGLDDGLAIDFSTPLISTLKIKTAELINICEELKYKDARLASLAQTAYEEACMWAIKAETTPEIQSEAQSAAPTQGTLEARTEDSIDVK